MDSGVKSRTLTQNPSSGPQNGNLGAMTKALITLTQVFWGPQLLIMGQELLFSTAQHLQSLPGSVTGVTFFSSISWVNLGPVFPVLFLALSPAASA